MVKYIMCYVSCKLTHKVKLLFSTGCKYGFYSFFFFFNYLEMIYEYYVSLDVEQIPRRYYLIA